MNCISFSRAFERQGILELIIGDFYKLERIRRRNAFRMNISEFTQDRSIFCVVSFFDRIDHQINNLQKQ